MRTELQLLRVASIPGAGDQDDEFRVVNTELDLNHGHAQPVL